MRFWIMLLLAALWPSGAMANGEIRAEINMPATATIIDFETTKKICASRRAPHWCPVHLLVPPDEIVEDEFYTPEEELYIKAGMLGSEELAKRRRIQMVKNRLKQEAESVSE